MFKNICLQPLQFFIREIFSASRYKSFHVQIVEYGTNYARTEASLSDAFRREQSEQRSSRELLKYLKRSFLIRFYIKAPEEGEIQVLHDHEVRS